MHRSFDEPDWLIVRVPTCQPLVVLLQNMPTADTNACSDCPPATGKTFSTGVLAHSSTRAKGTRVQWGEGGAAQSLFRARRPHDKVYAVSGYSSSPQPSSACSPHQHTGAFLSRFHHQTQAVIGSVHQPLGSGVKPRAMCTSGRGVSDCFLAFRQSTRLTCLPFVLIIPILTGQNPVERALIAPSNIARHLPAPSLSSRFHMSTIPVSFLFIPHRHGPRLLKSPLMHFSIQRE